MSQPNIYKNIYTPAEVINQWRRTGAPCNGLAKPKATEMMVKRVGQQKSRESMWWKMTTCPKGKEELGVYMVIRMFRMNKKQFASHTPPRHGNYTSMQNHLSPHIGRKRASEGVHAALLCVYSFWKIFQFHFIHHRHLKLIELFPRNTFAFPSSPPAFSMRRATRKIRLYSLFFKSGSI